jgi:hypothetical protein
MAERTCAHCGRPTLKLERGQCHACYAYRQRTGRARPLHIHSPRPCQNCGQLVRWLPLDRCNPCYHYWYRTGRERPPERWQR